MEHLFVLSELSTADFEVPLIGDIVLTVSPMDSAQRFTCEAVARKRLSDYKKAYEMAVAEGDWSGPDLSDDAVCDGLYQLYYIQEVGARHVRDWRGVGNKDGSAPAPCTPDAVRAFLKVDKFASVFYAKMDAKQTARLLEGNVFRPLPDTSSVPGPLNVDIAQTDAPTAPETS